MSQDQIQLPGPDAYRIFDGEGGYDYRDDLPDEQSIAWSARYGRKWEGVFTATTVRRLIAEAVAAEREACALACDEAKAKSRNHLFRSGLSIAAGAIRSRGDQT